MRRIALLCAVTLSIAGAIAQAAELPSRHSASARASGQRAKAKPKSTRSSRRKGGSAGKAAHKRGSTSKRPKRNRHRTKKSRRARAAVIQTEGTLVTTAAAFAPVLLGDQTVESLVDTNSAGWAEAFPFTAQASGSVSSISVYVDSHNQATTLIAGLYSNNSGHPGALVTSGTFSSPKAGAWNQVHVNAGSVTSGSTYWLAVLGRGGALYFRDRNSGSCISENSRQTSLTSLPAAWTSGPTWSTCPVSAYAAGTAGTPVTSTQGSGATTTTTTTSTTTTTTPVPAPTPVPPTNALPPTISGTSADGQTLTASTGSWLNSPTSYTYQWQDCNTSGASCSAISGATSNTYTLAANDVGHTIRAAVTAANTGGSASATSAATSAVTAPASPPADTTAPAVTGSTVQGQTLSTSNGSWSNIPTSYTYQWQDCNTSGASCSAISGATSNTYTLTANDVGHTTRSVVSATNSAGSTSATSAATAAVTAPASPPADTTAPAVTGSTVQGQTLSTSNGSWSNIPTSYTYQWQDCNTSGASCSAISGATSNTYTLAAGDAGSTIRSVVTAANSAGSASASSAATGTVTASAVAVAVAVAVVAAAVAAATRARSTSRPAHSPRRSPAPARARSSAWPRAATARSRDPASPRWS